MSDQPKLPGGKYMSTVKLGPKGQIVIPKEVRQLYSIQPGDSLLLLADRDRGIALIPESHYREMSEFFARLFTQVFPTSTSS